MTIDSLQHFARTVQESVTKATVIEPPSMVDNASVEYRVSGMQVLINAMSNKRTYVTQISNVVLELEEEFRWKEERKTHAICNITTDHGLGRGVCRGICR